MAGTSGASQVCLASLVDLVCFVVLVHLVSFVQPKNQTNEIDQTNQKDQLIKRRGGDYGLACGGMALIISAASSFAISFKFGR